MNIRSKRNTGGGGRPLHPRSGLWLLGVVAMTGGCVGANYVPISNQTYPAKPSNCELEIFSAALPERPFDEIGVIESEGSFWKSDLGDLLPKVREEACRAGGDAIILGGEERFNAGENNDVPILRRTATVIVWR